CQLSSSYAQVWLFLPCSSRQTLSEESLSSVKRYFEAGRPIAVMGDLHYYDAAANSLNAHCNGERGSDAYFGSTEKRSDVYRLLTEVAGAKPVVVDPKIEVAPTTHTLRRAWSGVADVWNTTQFIDANGHPEV